MNTVVAAHWQMNVQTNTFTYIQVLMITLEIFRVTSLHASIHSVALVASTGTNSVLIRDHCVTYNWNKVDNIIR